MKYTLKIILIFFYATELATSHPTENSEFCQNLDSFYRAGKMQCGSSLSTADRAVGPPGKKGPVGQSGPIGPRGPPGIVDYERVESVFEAKIAEVGELEERILLMNETINKLSQLTEKIQDWIGRDCDVAYRRKCFKIPEDLHVVEDVVYNEAERMCRDSGWKLANIYSREHYESVATYLRTKISPPRSSATVWLSMTFNQENQTLLQSDGAIAQTLPWYPTYPLVDPQLTKINLHIESDEKLRKQGLAIFNPAWSSRSGALCEM